MASRRAAFVAGGAALLAARPAFAQTPAPVEIGYAILNPSAQEWPLLIAQAQGFFRDEGLRVTVYSGNTAPNVATQLATNAVQIADNGTDSWIAAVAHGLPIRLVAPVFNVNAYSLVVQPDIRSWADLRGKTVMVGTKQDVTAIALSQMAAAQKMTLDDFSIIAGGNSSARFAAILGGNVHGATLSQPYDLQAEARGMRILARAHDTAKDWVFSSVAVNVGWAAQNRATVVRVLRATRRAIRFGYAQRAAAVAALVDATHVDVAIAERAYEIDFRTWRAYDPDLKLSPAGLQTIGRAQIAFGAIAAMPALADLIDTSFAAEAVR